MAILRLSIRPPEPCIFTIYKPTIFKFCIHIIINKTAPFFDPLFECFENELRLGPSQIEVFELSFVSENIYKSFSIDRADK
jgi:hypothetical protein